MSRFTLYDYTGLDCTARVYSVLHAVMPQIHISLNQLDRPNVNLWSFLYVPFLLIVRFMWIVKIQKNCTNSGKFLVSIQNSEFFCHLIEYTLKN